MQSVWCEPNLLIWSIAAFKLSIGFKVKILSEYSISNLSGFSITFMPFDVKNFFNSYVMSKLL